MPDPQLPPAAAGQLITERPEYARWMDAIRAEDAVQQY